MELPLNNKFKNILLVPFILFLVIIVAPFIILDRARYCFNGLWLNYKFRNRWCSEGKHILFIYSESPTWQEYIESKIVPSIEKKAVFLNWSERSEWKQKMPLEAKALFHWGGSSEFNPMAIIFIPNAKWKVNTIRFHKAFKDYKRGKNQLLIEKESELYSYL